jgi:hypothetical protein
MFGCPRSGECLISLAMYFWVGLKIPAPLLLLLSERGESGVIGVARPSCEPAERACVFGRFGSQGCGRRGGL